ncbi:MAG: 3,4-dihydroxy-2-butanone 4-phosphate synthase [Desulfurococcales archaeon ex4484_58]|nr:MAG: 3,4-dihydroxy-2-butanone 4-phosphate synthase [Desulfurococcales archaeon ex4484_58]
MIDWMKVRNSLLKGLPVLVFDSIEREAETDMVFYASLIDYSKIAFLRREAGGLICFVSGKLFREVLNLPFLQDLIVKHTLLASLGNKKPRYGDPPAFNLWVNHVNTKTGINDRDRALTIRELYEVAQLIYKGYINEARERFLDNFYAPGHVPILTSRGLSNRRGHTELVVALALLTGLIPAIVIAEMLSEGSSMPYEDAKKYAQRHNLLFIDGVDIVAEAEKRGLVND